MSQKVSFSSVISNHGFRYLWFNQILVQLSYNALNFALIIWVYKLTGSNFAVSAYMLAVFLPAIIFGMFAGVFVDIVDRKKLIILIDLFLAISFIFFVFIKRSYPLILVNTFIVNSLAQFFMPSESSSIPMLVSKKQLFLANSLFSLTLYGSFMLGFSLGGPVLNHFGINTLFYLGAGLLFLAFILARNLPVIKVSRKAAHTFGRKVSFSVVGKMLDFTFEEATDTLRFIRGKVSVMTSIGLLSAVQGMVGILAVVTPAYLERVLRIHATDASYFVMLPLGLGMVSGALLIGRFFQHLPRRILVRPAILLAGLMLLLIGLVPFFAQIFQSTELPSYITHPRYFFRAPSLSSFFAVLAFLTGLATVAIIIPSQTALQENTPEADRGKIFAFLFVIMTSFSAVTAVLTGVLADLLGITPIFVALGSLIFLLGLISLRPDLFFRQGKLPFRIQEFLGLGHWER
ncbi:MAG: MFS transporter [bacterium]|nr:MFS transporter [bacterium]